MKRLTKDVFDRIKAAVEERAKELGVGGFMIIADFVTGVAMFALVNRQSALRVDVPDKKNANFASVAGAKFGMVFAHRKDTGDETGLMGEVPFKGGHISADQECSYDFSGGPQEIDLALMILAEAVHTADTSLPVQMITALAAERCGARIAYDKFCPACKKSLSFYGQAARCENCDWNGVNVAWFESSVGMTEPAADYDINNDPRD